MRITELHVLARYRFLVILWCHPGSGDVIARSSQPLFGLMMNMRSLDKAVELNYQWIAFDDVCYHVQVTVKNPNLLLLVVSLPNPPPEAMSFDGLPLGAIEAIKATYRTGFQEVEVLSHITWKPKWGMIFSDFVFLCY
ncbi:actin-related protein 2/3 complex subunit 2A [Arabidopsis lyrata subsp. lyrata]|uniref:actin-related protein 2/3 complex subunit 2A n=1 Tax=Arabidopsis lyrata subsp. lyrata TaxID=81972 RepID=UPI000A29EA1B|nr:actin-related protein 2/3 complex subunit 2A [Arabidopsis lyrata subsp. lyrata]XP_020876986.1 actin-related protein 2/3 complex subunit 2A [Arabidopsis lyrata subsp. lyrata]|eukprot:XP_020876985.1 actin-related protein 2/3 complex subunit 2A [Arabidopsis lyrata subsp. lyrata]